MHLLRIIKTTAVPASEGNHSGALKAPPRGLLNRRQRTFVGQNPEASGPQTVTREEASMETQKESKVASSFDTLRD